MFVSAISEYGIILIGHSALWHERFIPTKFKKDWWGLDHALPLLVAFAHSGSSS
jgi:hypothetical protein